VTHPAYLLARLNPKTVRHDIGAGGLPDLTTTDIAAALAFVPEGLGREMICRVWWPDGARLTAKDLDQLLMEAQLEEWRARGQALLDAQLLEAVADTADKKRYAKLRMETAKLRMWPRVGGDNSSYGPIRKAVLAEISADMKCPACRGRGLVILDRRLVACTACEGAGMVRTSDRTRAAMIEKDHKLYRRHYAVVYEWTFNLCRDAMAPAVRQFSAALRD